MLKLIDTKLTNKRIYLVIIVLVTFPLILSASGGGGINSKMAELVLQIGVIVFAARIGGMIFEKIKMPSVLGEMFTGIIIGPYALGSIPIPFFPHGLFSLAGGGGIPISIELYSFSTFASIILLFLAGLETDFNLFLRFSLTGTILGLGGVVFSFVLGDFIGMYVMQTGFMDPRALFFGVMSTATSVGITAKILSERRKIDSPEGVSIMAGAVIDDVVGIIILAIVIGIFESSKGGNPDANIDWGHIGIISLKAIGIWLIFTVLGIVFARKISGFLKIFKNITTVSVLSLALALVLAGIFEQAGLALIVGAYIMGLSLSRTDLSYIIQEKLEPLQAFFVPIFFTVMGMLVNLELLFSKEVLLFGFIYAVTAFAAKIVGCGIPSLFLKFNLRGALRIGVGMVPRGEVALIIAGIGLSYGILDDKMFGMAILMTLITTVAASPILNNVFNSDKPGTTMDIAEDKEVIRYDFPSRELSSIIEVKVVDNFSSEGFFLSVIDIDSDTKIYHFTKNVIDVSLFSSKDGLVFKVEKDDVQLVKTTMYETLIEQYEALGKLSLEKPKQLKNELSSSPTFSKRRVEKNILTDLLKKENIILDLKGSNTTEVMDELSELLYENGYIKDKEKVLSLLAARERVMPFGLAKGLAIPHIKTETVDGVKIALGVNKGGGVDFGAADQEKCKIILLIISNEKAGYLQVMTSFMSIFNDDVKREKIENMKVKNDVYDIILS